MAIEPAENDRGPVGDPARDSAVDSIRGHRENSTRGMQSQP